MEGNKFLSVEISVLPWYNWKKKTFYCDEDLNYARSVYTGSDDGSWFFCA